MDIISTGANEVGMPLLIGTHAMSWSFSNDDHGFLYFQDPHTSKFVWEFSPCIKTTIDDGCKAYDADKAAFFAYGNRQGQWAFPGKWFQSALLLKLGDVVYARHTSDPQKVYVLLYKSNNSADMSCRFDYAVTGREMQCCYSIEWIHNDRPDAKRDDRRRIRSDVPLLRLTTFNLNMPAVHESVIGEEVGFVLQSISPGVDVTHTYWTVEGMPIAAYVMTEQRGEYVFYDPPTLGVDFSPSWYWTQPGTYLVTLRVTAWVETEAGPQQQVKIASTRCIVSTPELVACTTQASDIITERRTRSEYPGDYVSFGSEPDEGDAVRGFYMEARIRKPAGLGTGTLRWVQLVKVNRVITNGDGSTSSVVSGTFKLDSSLPYDRDMNFTGTIRSPDTSDSPAQGYDETDLRLQWRDEYKMYLMYRSSKPGSIWATLALFPWQVNVDFVRFNEIWTFATKTFTNQNMPNRADKTLKKSTELPAWQAMADLNFNVVPPPVIKPREQDGFKLYCFKQFPPDLPVVGVPKYWLSKEEVEVMMGRKIGLSDVTVFNRNWFVTWGMLDDILGAATFGFPLYDVAELPVEYKLRKVDLVTVAGGRRPMYVFRVAVAPFVFNPRNYWAQFAHAPNLDGFADSEDHSIENYMKQLRAITGNQCTIDDSRMSRGDIRLSSNYPPPMAMFRDIAQLGQTLLIERYDTGQHFDDPDFPVQ